MYYSVIGILALLILNITNHDVIIKRTSGVGPSIQKHYRRFLFGIIAYYLTDIAWGILETYNQTQI